MPAATVSAKHTDAKSYDSIESHSILMNCCYNTEERRSARPCVDSRSGTTKWSKGRRSINLLRNGYERVAQWPSVAGLNEWQCDTRVRCAGRKKSVTLKTWRREVVENVALPPHLSSLYRTITGLCGKKVSTPPWIFNGKRRMMAHFKEEDRCNTATERHLTFIARIFVNLCKKIVKWPKLRTNFYLKFNFSSKKLIRNLKKKLSVTWVKQLFLFEMSPNSTM